MVCKAVGFSTQLVHSGISHLELLAEWEQIAGAMLRYEAASNMKIKGRRLLMGIRKAHRPS